MVMICVYCFDKQQAFENGKQLADMLYIKQN